MTTGEKLATARKQAGMSQNDLAEKLGVSFQAISLWERDENLPDIGHLVKIAKLFDISLDDLLGIDIPRDWTLKPHTFNAQRMYTYVKARAQAEGLTQTLSALPFAREKHHGQKRKAKTGDTSYIVHPLTLACHALAMGLVNDDVLAAALLHDVVEDCDVMPEMLPVSERVQETVRLVSKNMVDGDEKVIKPTYYGNIRKDSLASLIKCMDRCNNLSCMADGFSRKKMAEYITETEEYILPLLDVIKEVPEYNNASWLLRYQMMALLETFKRLL